MKTNFYWKFHFYRRNETKTTINTKNIKDKTLTTTTTTTLLMKTFKKKEN